MQLVSYQQQMTGMLPFVCLSVIGSWLIRRGNLSSMNTKRSHDCVGRVNITSMMVSVEFSRCILMSGTKQTLFFLSFILFCFSNFYKLHLATLMPRSYRTISFILSSTSTEKEDFSQHPGGEERSCFCNRLREKFLDAQYKTI